MKSNDPAADTALARQADLISKLARFVVKSTRLHQGVEPFDLAWCEDLLSVMNGLSSVGKKME